MSLSRGLITENRDLVSRATNTNLPVLPASLGKYVLRRELGRGGMGIVYEGEDTLLERPVAIKLLAPHYADEQALDRLLREARSAARLNHPNAVTVYDVGEHPSGVFIAMELIRGISAFDYLQQSGPFRWQDATRIVSEICHGLESAHAAGLIHRDIKPANIMLVDAAAPGNAGQNCAALGNKPGGDSKIRRPWAKLADFGLSRSLHQPAPATREGQVVGTPHYMSPEQIRGEQLDERTDLYSLGATYYTLLTGRLPFERDDVIQTLFAHCSATPPDPTAIVADLPTGCAPIVAKAMAKEPRERYASVEALLYDLQCVLCNEAALLGGEGAARGSTQPAGATQNQSPRRGLRLLAGAGIVTTSLIVAAILGWRWANPGNSATSETVRRMPQPARHAPPPVAHKPAMEPIGMRIQRPWSRHRDGVIQVDGELELISLAPDQRTLAWGITEGEQQHGRLTLFDIERREVVGMYLEETQYAALSSVAFLGERFVLIACSNYLLAYDRQQQRATTLLKLADGSARSIDVTPDLTRMVLGVGEWDDEGRVEIYDVTIAGDEVLLAHPRRANREHRTAVKAVAFSRDGRLVASASEDGAVIMGDGATGATKHHGQLPEPIGDWGEVGYAVAFSPEGRWLAAGGHTGVVLWDTTSGQRRVLPEEHARRILSIAFSTSGEHLASGSTDGIRIWNVEQGTQTGPTLAGHEGNVIIGLAFAESDSQLISAAFDRRIKFWNLPPLSAASSPKSHD